ncbi:MAG: shikimate kinase [Candidatus Latescibacterota bacterium]
MLGVPVFLTGFMGVGKSKIGGILARRLGRAFLDTDQMVEARAGKPVAAIFAEEGEAHFRGLEHAAVVEAAGRGDVVVSLGGGAIARDRNWEVIRRAGVLVCIDADVDTILTRVSRREDRPLLAGLDPQARRARIEALLAQRAVFYARADVRVESTESRPPEATAEILLARLEEWSARHQRGA